MSQSRTVMNVAQERELFRRFNEAQDRIAEIDALDTIDANAQYRRRRWVKKSHALREEIVEANLGLIIYQCSQRVYNMIEQDELVREGLIVLNKSVDKFEPKRGFKFSAYVCAALKNNFARLHRQSYLYSNRFKAADFDIVSVTNAGTTEQTFCEMDVHELLHNNPAGLTPVEVTTLRRRFGINCAPETYSNLSKEFRVCREQVRQIEKRALKKLKSHLSQRREL